MAEVHQNFLLRLPTELLFNVFDNLDQHSLSCLTRTCGHLQGAGTPKLYERMSLRAPVRWSRLPSLETLITSSGENLYGVRYISVETQNDPLRTSQQGPMDEFDQHLQHINFRLPSHHASHNMNQYIGMLVAKIPHRHLRGLR